MFQRTIKAIQTHYGGRLFRSRLEARYAVFFDHLGIHWQYEPEGFQLSDGSRYLPDFWIEQGRFFAEVRPSHEALDPRQFRFVQESGSSLLLLTGEPSLRVYKTLEALGDNGEAVELDVSLDMDWYSTRDEDRFFSCPGDLDPSRSVESQFSERFKMAASAALSARFESGDRG